MNEPFILTSWVKMCLGSFEKEGMPTAELCRRANVSEAVLGQPLLAVSAANALFKAAIALSNNPLIGINAGRNVSPTTFYALGYAAIASENLLAGFQLIAHYSFGITDITRLFLTETSDSVSFGFDKAPAGMHFHPVGSDAALCMIVRICRQLQEGPAIIREVTMARPRPEHWQPYEHYFKAPVRWNSEQFSVQFDRNYFLRPNQHADRHLANENKKLAAEYFGRLLSNSRYTHTVRRYINQSLAEKELTLLQIAEALNMSERTLQRQLSLEGSCFRDLVDEVKKEAALRFLQSAHLNVSQIAYALGFNDSGNFTRAFKRWYGCAPLTYRQHTNEMSREDNECCFSIAS